MIVQYPGFPHTAQTENKITSSTPKLLTVELNLNIWVEMEKPRKEWQKFRLQKGWLHNVKFFVGFMMRMDLKVILRG